MTKKFFLLLTAIFTLIICSSSVYAMSDIMSNGMNDMGTQMKDSWDKTGDTMQHVGNAVRTGVTNVGSMLTGNDNNNNNTNYNNDNEYTAVRTSTETPTVMGMNATMWTWLVFGILAVVLVGLVWFYGMQHQDIHDERRD